ncbi:hypothetical protein HHI36_001418 [Cryptolaemus montrouzieri]|uniref:Uncharacterized protein n=1 Tax=Cryptolaemus montrouzieri TaxID=559131 RepID=A0ABD2P7M1_9CUCU
MIGAMKNGKTFCFVSNPGFAFNLQMCVIVSIKTIMPGAFTLAQVSIEIPDLQQTLENGEIDKPLENLNSDVSEAMNKQNPNSNKEKKNMMAHRIFGTGEMCLINIGFLEMISMLSMYRGMI